MASLTVSTKGKVTLNQDMLEHLGIKPGDWVKFEKLPGGELSMRAARPTGSLDTNLSSNIE